MEVSNFGLFVVPHLRHIARRSCSLKFTVYRITYHVDNPSPEPHVRVPQVPKALPSLEREKHLRSSKTTPIKKDPIISNDSNHRQSIKVSITNVLEGSISDVSHFTCRDPFQTEFGVEMIGIKIGWKEWGDPNGPVILLCPSFSMGCHARSTANEPTPGWWEGMVGDDLALDTKKYRIICPDILGAPFTTTNATSINPETQRNWGPDFPIITPVDQVRVHKRLLEHLGIKKIKAVVGASLGGMQALTFAAEFPDSVEKVIALCTTAQSSPTTIAFRYVQKLAIRSDPNFNGGRYSPDGPPLHGLAVARALGTICYRSRAEFDERFQWSPLHVNQKDVSYDVESYLNAQASKFNRQYDANCYLTLSRCADLQDLARGHDSYEEGVGRIQAEALLMGFTHDALIPSTELKRVQNVLHSRGVRAEYVESDSLLGHDAFLKEWKWMTDHIRSFL
ncbi:putative homoserine O-acetyltransferase [Planoprotostelium fungivorum]|uniref:Putative homoserine O-acetyltransferase n=1 Tax=Planoprotostelium fungivorum TaxID=1890364 RepID=A0A2P6NQY5_9EUKA|nr:putative homoserine O-acetyltransferase [Planoprotostelium fungivorum]